MHAYYCQLEQDALLHITGADALTFLQGQTTCDTSELTPSQALLGAYCNPQGRMNSDFLLCQLADQHFALRMRSNIMDNCAAVFGKYIVFSKAELEAKHPHWQAYACWGTDVADTLEPLFDKMPEGRLGVSSNDHAVLVQIDEAGCQFECYINSPEGVNPLTGLAGLEHVEGESAWQALQIQSGIGRIEEATINEFIPQMLNYDLTDHVSFTKGCYTGQEVVARMHYRGKPKRRTYLASLESDPLPPPGTALFTSGNEQSVGTIVNSAIDSLGHRHALVVATEGGIENGLAIGSQEGAKLSIEALPYSMERN